jgi:NADH dehydrogenase
MINLTMTREYPDLAVKRAQVYLVEHGPTLLAPFSVDAHEYAARILRQKGVRLLLGEAVTEVGSDRVGLSGGTSIPTRTVVWAGGLMASALADNSGLPKGRGGRIVGSRTSRSRASCVYALGDFANIPVRTASRFRNSRPCAAMRVWTANNILPRSRANLEPPSIITTRASWP